MGPEVIDTTAVAVAPKPGGLLAGAVTPGEILGIINHVHAVIKDAMKEGIDADYGVLPGTTGKDGKPPKKVLFKPGAEKLLLAFGLTAIPRKPIINDLEGGHREIIVETEIRSMITDRLHAVGLGSCSTMETKYRWRNAERICPECGQGTIIKGKAEYGGGWLCFAKRGGCGAKFPEGDERIEGQQVGKAENADIADVYNTVLKLSSKRSMVDGTIRATASSGLFTQDMEGEAEKAAREKAEAEGKAGASTAKTTGSGSRPPASTATGKTPPPATAGTNVGRGIVQKVFPKADKKPWGVYIGDSMPSAEKYTTFSDTVGKAAANLKGADVVITWNPEGEGGKYRTLMSIVGAPVEAAGQEQPAEAGAERSAEDEAFDRELAAQGL